MDPHASPELRLHLPVWLAAAEHAAASARFPTPEMRMDWVLALAVQNFARRDGGPFAAAVFDSADGRLIAAGVNRVEATRCSLAHAEMLALGRAQAAVGAWNLSGDARTCVLVSSAEPCAMCLGALPWSGIAALEFGASDADVRAIGFDEGDKPADWAQLLRHRGIQVLGEVLRLQAVEVLQAYVTSGGTLYQPRPAP